MFCLSFVVVTVKARLAGLDPSLEQAAMDLYANEWQTFWRITFPLVFPGIMAAALLSFSLSFDDFIVTNFNHGNTITFPMFVWGSAQRGIPPQVNVVGTVMFVIALLLVLGGELRPSAGARRAPDVTDPAPRSALADAAPTVFWLDDPDRPAPLAAAARSRRRRDLLVVGGGYTGLWTALRAKERDPSRRRGAASRPASCGDQASGRNGGFASASLTHGFANGLERWPDELAALRPARRREPRARSATPCAATASTAPGRRPASSPSPPPPHEVESSPASRPRCGAPGTTCACSTGTRCAPRSTRRRTSAGCWERDAHRDGRAGPAGLGAARGVPRRRRPRLRGHRGDRRSSGDAGAVHVRTAARRRSAPAGWCSAPTRSRRCCAGCG